MAHEQQQQQQQQQEKEKQESPLGVAGDGKEDLQRDGRAEVVGAEPRAQTAPQGRAPAQNSGKERRRDFLRHRHSSGGRGASADTAASARSVNLNGLSDLLRSMEDDIANVGRRLDGTGGFNSSDDIAENLAEDDAEMVASAAVSLGVNGSHDNDEDNFGNDAGDVASANMSHIDDGDDAPFAGAQASRRRPDPMNDMPMFPTWFGRSVSDFTNGIASPRSFDDAQSDETKSLGKDHRSSDDSDSVNVSDSIARTRTSVGPSVRRVYSPVSQLRKTLKRTHSTGDECEYDLTQDMRKTVTSGQMQRKLTRQDLEKLGAHARFGSGVLTASHKHNRLGAYTLYYRLKFENGLKKTITSNVGIHVSSIILDHIGPEWALVRESELAQMRLFVFAKKAHLHAISDVQYASEATGVGGIGANKGGVAASFTMYGMRMGWISCHLAAHKKQRYLKARNNDLAEIFMSFDKKLSSRWYNLTSVLDHIFLLGDLNYRIDLGLAGLVPTSAVKMVQRLPTDSSMQSYLSSNGVVRATARTASSSSASLITPSSKAKSSSGAQKQQTTSANALSRFSSSEACEDDCESDDGSAVFKPESGDLIVEIKADVSAAESGDRPQIQSTPSRHTDSEDVSVSTLGSSFKSDLAEAVPFVFFCNAGTIAEVRPPTVMKSIL
ncbi:Phosphatidylinositol 3,4,5-trisphosphate 5-phosphatase 1 [Hondaea fermentalgiana]|uniref:Phosphatidylinositol 3,4,5-trisphosphate 5-phosphatase 1 n=1 Tax=Hondaea fermentalgiana TaxID=2315210 RepID=A0A2R5GCN1_9STRA|nr:Phosphatidylinositol 3,4,5-trisphosphate 5-phosphatase 1 [Hondaea fermentalgiana]|eukprot:GBG27468.1 Phosphatidylinositol 3,4,5-trisphosphate 5-phosphatase 1 [Hondaea fermentalgiana]